MKGLKDAEEGRVLTTEDVLEQVRIYNYYANQNVVDNILGFGVSFNKNALID